MYLEYTVPKFKELLQFHKHRYDTTQKLIFILNNVNSPALRTPHFYTARAWRV